MNGQQGGAKVTFSPKFLYENTKFSRFGSSCSIPLRRLHRNMAFRALRMFNVDQHVTCLEANRIVTACVDSVAGTVTLARGVSSDDLGYNQPPAHGPGLTLAPLGQLYAAVENGSLEDAFWAACQTQNRQVILISEMEEPLVTEVRFLFDRRYKRLISLEQGHRQTFGSDDSITFKDLVYKTAFGRKQSKMNWVRPFG